MTGKKLTPRQLEVLRNIRDGRPSSAYADRPNRRCRSIGGAHRRMMEHLKRQGYVTDVYSPKLTHKGWATVE